MRPNAALTCITMVQVICSVSIIAITSNRITHPGFGTQKRCYLSSDPYNTSPCSFAYAAAGISLGFAVLAGCLRRCSFDCCGLGPIQSIVLAGVNCLWWLVAASTLTAVAVAADAAGLPAEAARHMILTAAWVAAGAELVHSCVACLVVGNNVCNILLCIDEPPEACCGGCCVGCCRCCRRGRRRRPQGAAHQPLLPPPAAAAAAAAATGALLHQGGWWGRQRQGLVGQPVTRVTVVTQQQGGPGGYMPPPPTAGQPYVVVPGAGPPAAAPSAAAAAWTPGPAGSSFGGFATGGPAAAAAGHAGAAGTPSLSYGLAQAQLQPSAPQGPQQQQQQQQQQQAYAPPVVLPQMQKGGADTYPSIPKE